MSIRVLSAVWQHSKAKSGDLLVALAIADYSNDEGFAFPAIQTLAKKARLSSRQVKRAIDRLYRLGELTVFKNKGPHGVNRYRILLGDNLSRGQDVMVTPMTAEGDIHVTRVVTSTSPNPSSEPSGNLGGEIATHNGKLRPISEAVLSVMQKYKNAGLCR